MIPKSALWALDFGEHRVTVVAGREKASGDWTLLGQGRSRAQGRERGEIVKLSDVCESVTEAVRQAEKSAGLRCRKLYFNFDDTGIVTAHPSGFKTLSGEGQIRREDVRDAARSASRMADDFQRAPVYARETAYLIDGKDPVGDPVGVFGHRLDVTLHVVLARAALAEQWKTVMRRAQIERFAPVLSLDSASRSVLDRSAQRRIIWDLGEDFASGGVFELGALREYRVFSSSGLKAQEVSEKTEEISRRWLSEKEAVEPLVLTGDWAEKASVGLQSVVAAPKGLPGFHAPSDAALAGLLMAASQRERGIASVKSGEQWARRAREKANAFIQEYF